MKFALRRVDAILFSDIAFDSFNVLSLRTGHHHELAIERLGLFKSTISMHYWSY